MGFFNKTSLNRPKPLAIIPECGACGLYKGCQSPKMPPSGLGKYKILFVGESPGQTEDEQGTQFVGKAGQCLRNMLMQVDEGIDLDDCWVTNSVICHPKGNNTEDKHIGFCRANVTNTIARLKPQVIVPLGAHAIDSLISPEWGGNLGTVRKWVGWTIPSPMHKAWVCPTYHPSYVLRSNEDEPLVNEVVRHLSSAFKLLKTPCAPLNASELAKQVEIITDPRQGALRIAELAKKPGRVAFDYETTGLKPERKEQHIYSVSFAWEGGCFATLVNEDSHAALSAFLLNTKISKIASNLKFETRWTKQKLGHDVVNWEHCTMLCAHYLDNREGITSIKFQSYIHFGIGDYDSHIKKFLIADTDNGLNQIEKAPVRELLIYNALDSILELRVAEKQMKQLELA